MRPAPWNRHTEKCRWQCPYCKQDVYATSVGEGYAELMCAQCKYLNWKLWADSNWNK